MACSHNEAPSWRPLRTALAAFSRAAAQEDQVATYPNHQADQDINEGRRTHACSDSISYACAQPNKQFHSASQPNYCANYHCHGEAIPHQCAHANSARNFDRDGYRQRNTATADGDRYAPTSLSRSRCDDHS